MPLHGGGTVTLSIDLSIAADVGKTQDIYYAESSSDFILGVPFWAQYYTLVDLGAGTFSVYTPPPAGTCSYPTQKPSANPTLMCVLFFFPILIVSQQKNLLF